MSAAEAIKQRKRAEAAQRRAEEACMTGSDAPALLPRPLVAPAAGAGAVTHGGGNGASADNLTATGTAGAPPPGPPWRWAVGPVVRPHERLPALRMMTAILVAWVAAIASGLMLHAGIIHGHKPPAGVSLPLLWFDQLLRRYGALLPAPILALRAAAVLLTPGARARVSHGGASTDTAGEPAAWLWHRREFGEALVVYAGITVVRWWVYGLHQAGVFYIMWSAGVVSAAPVQLMSDHVFLGSSLAAVLGAEAVLLRLHIGRRAVVPRHPAEHPLLWAGLLLCAVMLLLVCGDMHFTARFFHMPTESFWGAISGLGILQLPVCWWLLYGFLPAGPHAAP